MPAILNYLLHLLLAAGLFLAFFVIYTKITPFDEVQLVRQGNLAAANSLGGALIGFSLTIASALAHTVTYQEFLMWAATAMVVQLLVFWAATALLKISKDQIESNNKAFGTLLGAISISIGAINAGCIS